MFFRAKTPKINKILVGTEWAKLKKVASKIERYSQMI